MEIVRYDINRYSPGQMVVLPLVLLLIAGMVLAASTFMTGTPVELGIDFAGGTAVTVFTPDSVAEIEAYFADYPLLSIDESVNNGKYIKFGPMEDDQFRALSEAVVDRYPNAGIDQIGETFGKTLQQQALLALIFSFIGMSIVVFIAFRSAVPSIAVVLSAFSDIAITAAAMSILGMPLSLGTTAALLMLIGYSVDSDILLTSRVLKRKGKLAEKLGGAFRTGFIMTTTTLSALVAMWVVAVAGQVQIIAAIASVLIIGLVIDLMNTWLLNAGIIKWYVQKGGNR
ncbi:protein translocase subunit SecF [Methanoculleus sp. FWC-SCC1]|uniref:Protein-export membrane protein SecF n=1 Tax=Methanoculleus frigidifontis TaxID=2584085 RepID=A0ABT8M910_9EURY|nr:protein translocase subunit SecF [Methanoculleus sp. FWC-SCC1]MDN7024411.1 protein translocase subunit SecF [Methanoculleus sp. FWC-SCC1]